MSVIINDVTHGTVMGFLAIQWTMNLITREEMAASLSFTTIITGVWSVMSIVVFVKCGLFLMDMETMFVLEKKNMKFWKIFLKFFEIFENFF